MEDMKHTRTRKRPTEKIINFTSDNSVYKVQEKVH